MGLTVEQHRNMKDCQNKKRGGGGDVKRIGEILKASRNYKASLLE